MRLSHLTLALGITLGLSALVACGPATPDAVTPPPPAATAAPAVTAAPTAAPAAQTATPVAPPAAAVAFSTMSNEQKVAHMKAVITPRMAKIFQEGDAKKYADFGCKTCHGEKKQDPHVVLPALTLSGDGFKKLSAQKPAVMKFMAETVTPAMAAAMGEKPYDPATHKGFGCGGCHRVN